MWCVLKCRTGKEEEIMASCRRNISGEILWDIFMFTYERMRRYEGSWHMETRQMFPGYLFLETDDPETLADAVRPYRGMAQTDTDGNTLRIVQPEEERFLKDLCGGTHHLAISQGYIRDGITHIIHGPLVGMERRIRRIDRHKRTASICVADGGEERLVTAGLEITAKN